MIPKSSKFPSRTQFLALRERAKQTTTPHLRALFSNITHPVCDSRLSVIVPIKVNKLAVVRNHLKRLVYDTLWPIIKDKNLDCVVLFKPTTLLKGKISKDLITHELSQLIDLH